MRKDWKRFAALALVATVFLGDIQQNTLYASAQELQTEVTVETETSVQEELDLTESVEIESTDQETTSQETESGTKQESETVNEETNSESNEGDLSEEESILQEKEETLAEETMAETSEWMNQMELNASASDFVIVNGVLTKYTGSDEVITIPDGVITIGDSVFERNTKIKKVVLSSSVRTIDDYAFRYCSNLQELELNEGLITIGSYAFEHTPLGTVYETGKVELGTLTIPGTVQFIGGGAFNGCKYLGEIKFEDGENKTLGIVSYWGYPVFGECTNLTKVDLPDRLEVIPEYAFRDDVSLREVTFGSGTKTIGDGAFSGCKSLKPVEFNDGLVTIGSSAFYGVAFGEVFDTGKIEYGTITIPASVKYIYNGAFRSCRYLKEIIFEDGENETLVITSNRAYPAFGNCANLTKVDLPERLKTIPCAAFWEDTGLKEVLLGSKIETIGEAAFQECSALKDITFPQTVKTIEQQAFRYCSSLKAPQLNEGLKVIGDEAFSYAALGEKLENGKIETGTLTIPSTVQAIGWGAFRNCTYLGEVIFSDGETVVLNMGSAAGYPLFGNCINLRRVDFPKRLETIPDYAFYDCKSLREVVFEENIRTIEDSAFYGCTSLCDLKLNEGLKTIGSDAFYGASLGKYNSKTGKIELGTVVIPSTVQYIGDGAFCRCSYMEKIIFANGETVVLTIKSGAWGALEWCTNLTTVVLPERIQYLSIETFDLSKNLKKLYIPQGVTEISGNLLRYCPNATIYGVPGSYAEKYAEQYKIPFKDKEQLKIDDDDSQQTQTDSKPKIDDSKCIINLNSDVKSGILSIYPTNGYSINTQSLAIQKTNGTDSQFTITKVDGSNTQYTITGSNLKKGDYKVVLSAKTSACEQQPYKIPFTIHVVEKQPQVKVSQVALQLYKKDSRGKVFIDTDTAISKIEYTPATTKSAVVLEQKETNCEKAYFTYGISSNADASNYLTAGTKGSLKIWFEGYSNPYTMDLALKVDKNLPKLTAPSVTLYPKNGISETTIRILNANGNAISAENGYSVVATEAKFVDVIPMSDSTLLKVKAKENSKNETLKLIVSNENWIPSVKVSCTVKVAKNPKLVFSSAKITLNTLNSEEYKFAGKQVTVTPYIQGASDVDLVDIVFEGKNAKSKDAYLDGKGGLTLQYQDGVIAAAAEQSVPKGTYTYTVTATTKDGLKVTGTLTVVVTNTKPDVSVKAKGTIDVLRREESCVTYTFTPKNFSDRIVNATLEGSEAELFDLSFEEGKAVLRAKEGVELKIKNNYLIPIKITFASGAELTKKVTVKLNQKNPKLSVNPSKCFMFRSASGTENGQDIVVRTAGGLSIAKIELVNDYDTFEYTYNGSGKGNLSVLSEAKGKVNKNYSLKFAVTLDDAATNAKPIYVTVTVKYSK